ncbi:MAG: N-acetylmuramoyl-L-alanine amidase [Akkermansiaceae bacterium]|nr:N-acetylmuramoyl-L-alanine amidase [Akkermansiaceae bacterium]
MLSSCAGPSTGRAASGSGSSLRPDEWGHRAGPQGFRTVIIDAGHGGKDSGAVSPWNGVKEKDLTLDTARRVQSLLSGKVKTQLMRGDDTFVELDDRVARASSRDATILVSIHYNSGPAGLRGPETYYWRVDSHGLATRIQRNISSVAPAQSGNRGLVRRRIRLTRNPNVPCVLVEVGYISSPGEVKLCSDPAYRDRMARAIAGAILDQQQKGDAGTGPLPRPLNEPPSRPSDPAGS